ncbi:hypothetical protein [Novosphingobium sp. 9U]|uniref:hypothetical protein n=1 Tax=Novosphingobium sp. 9U TaxID=2653158 RepID=UPI0012F22496|nr:hypothetical protein [Novosphingobium sp. 9U]VWX52768.1 Eukaryotic translation initiation factor 4B [Novosphingobium sp. 9U]
MSQDKPSDGSAKQPADPDALSERVNDDVGGVQGEAPDEQADDGVEAVLRPGGPDSEPAPDAGEIEWAGQVVKKPPAPQA